MEFNTKFACKFQAFRTLEEVRKGVDAPERKMLNQTDNPSTGGYEDICPVDDDSEELPF